MSEQKASIDDFDIDSKDMPPGTYIVPNERPGMKKDDYIPDINPLIIKRDKQDKRDNPGIGVPLELPVYNPNKASDQSENSNNSYQDPERGFAIVDYRILSSYSK